MVILGRTGVGATIGVGAEVGTFTTLGVATVSVCFGEGLAKNQMPAPTSATIKQRMNHWTFCSRRIHGNKSSTMIRRSFVTIHTIKSGYNRNFVGACPSRIAASYPQPPLTLSMLKWGAD
jgi:hypothetical protein